MLGEDSDVWSGNFSIPLSSLGQLLFIVQLGPSYQSWPEDSNFHHTTIRYKRLQKMKFTTGVCDNFEKS